MVSELRAGAPDAGPPGVHKQLSGDLHQLLCDKAEVIHLPLQLSPSMLVLCASADGPRTPERLPNVVYINA